MYKYCPHCGKPFLEPDNHEALVDHKLTAFGAVTAAVVVLQLRAVSRHRDLEHIVELILRHFLSLLSRKAPVRPAVARDLVVAERITLVTHRAAVRDDARRA